MTIRVLLHQSQLVGDWVTVSSAPGENQLRQRIANQTYRALSVKIDLGLETLLLFDIRPGLKEWEQDVSGDWRGRIVVSAYSSGLELVYQPGAADEDPPGGYNTELKQFLLDEWERVHNLVVNSTNVQRLMFIENKEYIWQAFSKSSDPVALMDTWTDCFKQVHGHAPKVKDVKQSLGCFFLDSADLFKQKITFDIMKGNILNVP